MLLALDVGNTNITLGVFQGDQLVADARVRTDRKRTADEYGLLFTYLLRHREVDPAGVADVAISNVVPTLADTLSAAACRYFHTEPFYVNADVSLGFAVRCNPPSEVGADRLCNIAGASGRCGVPAVVVDLGTATTLDVIAANGDFLGGAIAPGIGISSEALYRVAARLHRVPLAIPSRAIGNTTVEAMQSGIVFGFAGQVDALVRRSLKEVGGTARVIATGGLAPLIQGVSDTIEVVDPMLTLEGLRLLWERNRK